MTTWIKVSLASIALGGLLAGCATYDYDYGYGYGYSRPYYYGYDYGPAYYDYPYYGPAYYGAPAIGFNFGYRDFDRHRRGGGRHLDRGSHNYTAGHRGSSRPAPVSQARGDRTRGRVTALHGHVPAARAPQRTQRAQRGGGNGNAARATMRAEQQ